MDWSATLRETLTRWRQAAETRLRADASDDDPWGAGWYEAIRSQCEALDATRWAVSGFVLRGERWVRFQPARMLRLEEMACRAAEGFDVDVSVDYEHEAPVVRITARGSVVESSAGGCAA